MLSNGKIKAKFAAISKKFNVEIVVAECQAIVHDLFRGSFNILTFGSKGISMVITALKRICRGIDIVVMLTGVAASFLMPLLAFVVAYEVLSK